MQQVIVEDGLQNVCRTQSLLGCEKPDVSDSDNRILVV